ncbi:MAG: GNAT family N-acetyltransferase [Spirochaetota bacterium]
MVGLAESDYRVVLPLLDRVPFNVLLARAVADGSAAGEIYVDSRDPASCYVRHAYGMSFLVGEPRDESCRAALLRRLADRTRRDGATEMLQAYPESWHDAIAPLVRDGAVKLWGRTNFRFEESVFRARWPAPPGGEDTVRCDASHLARFAGSVTADRFWKSANDFLACGVGFASVEADGSVASIAFSAYRDARRLEIGVETAPACRGRGLATRTSARLVRYCLEHGLEPVWSCRTENEGSYRLAERLGFAPSLRHPYYELL